MKKICLILSICLASCQQQSPTSNLTEQHHKVIPTYFEKIVDSLHLQAKVAETKWRLYCIHCDEKVEFIRPTSSEKMFTFGELQLKDDTLFLRKDTVELDYQFYYNDTPCYANFVHNTLMWGCIFRLSSDTPVAYSSMTTMRSFWETCDVPNCPSRFVNPLQPQVISYIKRNKQNINKWFHDEAVKRHVIN